MFPLKELLQRALNAFKTPLFKNIALPTSTHLLRSEDPFPDISLRPQKTLNYWVITGPLPGT